MAAVARWRLLAGKTAAITEGMTGMRRAIALDYGIEESGELHGMVVNAGRTNTQVRA